MAFKTRVNLKVFNAEGKEIVQLVDEEKKPGTYEVKFFKCHSRESGNPNTFVYYIAMWVRRFFAERDQAALGFGLSLGLQIVISILASILISWFSRHREYGADAFSAKVYGKDSMISALRAIDEMGHPFASRVLLAGCACNDENCGQFVRTMASFRDAPADRSAHRGARATLIGGRLP